MALQPKADLRPRKDTLARNPKRLREHRAQALVPLNQVTKRSLQRRKLKPTPKTQRQRDRVSRARSLQPVQKPQPVLRKRQRNLSRPNHRPQRRPRQTPLVVQTPPQTRNRRRLKQRSDADLNLQALADAADQPRRQKRMAPQRKKVVLNPNPLKPQHLRKQPAQDLLLGRARQPQNRSRHLRHRQRTTVQLAVWRQRKPIQNHKRRRNHVVRQSPRQMIPQLRNLNRGTRSQNHIRHQPLAARTILARNNRRLPNTAMPQQAGLDLARLNPETAQLHLRVRTTQKLQHPVRSPPPQIPGPVHPRPRHPIRVRNKPLPGQATTPDIAPRKTAPRDVQLPRHPGRNRPQATIQHIHPRVRDRTPKRGRAPRNQR